MESIKARFYGLLRRSERLFKTDMVYLFHGSFWLTGSQLLNAVISFALTVVFANALSPTNYGTYEYILSIYGLFGTLALTGLGIAVTRAVAKGHDGEFINALKVNFRWSFILTGLSCLIAGYYFTHHNNTLGVGLLIIAIFLPILDTAEMYPSYLSGKKDFKTLSLVGTVRIAISAIWLMLALTFTKNPVWLVLAYFIINATVAVMILRKSLAKHPPNTERDAETIRLAKHASFINNFGAFFDQTDSIIVFHLLGPVPLAIYNFSIAIPEYLAGFLKNIGSLAVPKYAIADKAAIKKTMLGKSLQLSFLGLLMAIIYIFVSPAFFHLFFPKYLSSIPYSQIYSLMLLLSAVLPIAFIDSQVAIRERYILGFWNLPKAIIIYFAVFYYGLWGAIIAKVITKYIGALMGFFFAQRV
jgi:O-antigen/teichoic acid export membrane protein